MKGRDASFDVKKVCGRRRETTGDHSASRAVQYLQLQDVGRIREGEPTRGSVSEDREKKGFEERGQELLGRTPGSGGNSLKSFKTWEKLGSQGRDVGAKGEGPVKGNAEEDGFGLKGQERAIKKKLRLKRSF